MMTLAHVIDRIAGFPVEAVIFASEPWTCDSVAIVEIEPDEGGSPEGAIALGLKYFLEVSIAREFLEDWVMTIEAKAGKESKCQRLIRYAINDA